MKLKLIEKIINKKQKRDKEKIIYRNNNISINKKDQKRIHLDINGTNNTICIHQLSREQNGELHLKIYGNNCQIIIGENFTLTNNLNIIVGQYHKNFNILENVKIEIGNNVTCESANISTFNSGSEIIIGNDCMIANNVTFLNTDVHPIFERNTNKIINYVSKMKIGNNCWIGNNAVILKNVEIADNCIIGYNATVTKNFTKEYCSIAGNPARIIKEDVEWSAYGYEYCNNDYVKVPQIATPEETIEKLINEEVSICRFGDGEFRLMLEEGDLDFEVLSPEIVKRLKNVINSNNSNLLIATNNFYFTSLKNMYKNGYNWTTNYLFTNRSKIKECLKLNKKYYSAEFSSLYLIKKNINYETYFDSVRKIWANKDITIIQGKNIDINYKYNIFDNANSIEYIFAPSKNAFEKYENILYKAKQIDKTRMIIIILGPTATILAYDLSKLGYRALDLGHIAKSYDWYKQQINIEDNIFKFYSEE